jgi:serine/threonine protein kinase
MAQPPVTSDYWVGPVIGEGSFAQVMYCIHKASARKVAIKVIERVTCQKHPHVSQGLFTERNLLHDLRSCPQVVNLWASFVDSECVYMVMELATGGDFQDLIRRGLSSLSLRDAWTKSIPYYIKQLVELVRFLQSKKIVHADLKPQNILCHSDGRLCLADFASAIKLDDKPIPDTTVPRGTSQYACPELIKSQTLTLAVDSWSLGCMLYCMFVGKSPFETESEALTVQAIMNYEKRCSEKGSSNVMFEGYSCCSGWERFIRGLLDPDPGQRLQIFEDCQKLMPIQCTPPKESLLLPKPPWEDAISEATLRDGALGWGVFML